MSKSLNTIWQYLRAFVLIYACLYAGIFIASLLPITIPGSIIGMLILFVLLALQVPLPLTSFDGQPQLRSTPYEPSATARAAFSASHSGYWPSSWTRTSVPDGVRL